MGKKIVACALVCTLALVLLCGCADYRGLNELTVVAGVAVDVSEDNPGWMSVTFEIVDMHAAAASEQHTSKTLTTEGLSYAEAVYNANTKLHNDMYFGNTEIVIISYQYAQQHGIHGILDTLLRDRNSRDNMHLLISGETSAKEVISPVPEAEGIISFDISDNLAAHANSVNATHALELYQIYNLLALKTSDLALPVLRLAEEKEEYSFQGMALFTGDLLTGYMGEDSMPYYLMGVSNLQGGGYAIEGELDGEDRYFSLAHRGSQSKVAFTAGEDDALHFVISVAVDADVVELSPGWGPVDSDLIAMLEDTASQYLSEGVEQFAANMQDSGYDVLNLIDTVRNHDYRLWERVGQDRRWLETCTIEADVRVSIKNTGMIERY